MWQWVQDQCLGQKVIKHGIVSNAWSRTKDYNLWTLYKIYSKNLKEHVTKSGLIQQFPQWWKYLTVKGTRWCTENISKLWSVGKILGQIVHKQTFGVQFPVGGETLVQKITMHMVSFYRSPIQFHADARDLTEGSTVFHHTIPFKVICFKMHEKFEIK